MKWTPKLDKTTPCHMIYLETNRKNIITMICTRAIAYEEKIMKYEDIMKEYIRVKNKTITESRKKREMRGKLKKERKGFLESNFTTIVRFLHWKSSSSDP